MDVQIYAIDYFIQYYWIIWVNGNTKSESKDDIDSLIKVYQVEMHQESDRMCCTKNIFVNIF